MPPVKLIVPSWAIVRLVHCGRLAPVFGPLYWECLAISSSKLRDISNTSDHYIANLTEITGEAICWRRQVADIDLAIQAAVVIGKGIFNIAITPK